jgi:pyruvate/2-oxoglutarate/acetoin dehydrogenase E1 component
MKYFDELKRSMDWLNEQPNTLFLGQAVEYAGTGMTNTLKDVDQKQIMLEMPVNEDMQMGLSVRYGFKWYCSYFNCIQDGIFLILAANQLINHLDKVKIMSDGGYTPKVIIRTWYWFTTSTYIHSTNI